MALSFDRDHLIALLHRGAEAAELDYKSTWDPADKRSLIELCKDIAAMESLPGGGHIVIGATDEGAPSGLFSPADISAYDEQKLRSKVVSILGEPLDFGSSLQVLQEDHYLLIAVGPHPTAFESCRKTAGTKTVSCGSRRTYSFDEEPRVRAGTSTKPEASSLEL